MRTLHRDAISLSVTALAAAMTATSALADVRIQVDVTTVRSIDGHSELDRNKFFAVCDSGSIAQRAPDDQTLDFLLDDLDVRFGRQLGPVRWGLGGRASYQEDPSRPGFVDADNVREVARPTPYAESFKAKAGRLNVVAHGAHAGFPDFMGERQTDVTAEQDPKNHLPDNIEAAAELSALIFKYGYSDFDRPIWYEPINEPHWTHFREQHLADWHVATVAAFEAAALDTLVGGPCLSVAYFYKNGFNGFNGLKQFIDDTDGRLPFYSFHAYDYFTWEDGELGGRVTSGLPLHGSLDIVAAYGHHEYGRVFPIVLSEHGGYVNRGADAFRDDVIGPRQDVTTEAGWEHEMRRRSLDAFQLVSSVIANTLVFMDHPHTVEKAVPFILPESMAWDPEYYSVMWVPKHFTDMNDWVPTDNQLFYKLFAGVQGQHVVATSDDPDIQVQAFREDSDLWLVLNNLADKPETLRIDLGEITASGTARRFGHTDQLTPTFSEEAVTRLDAFELAGRESVVIHVEELPREPMTTVLETPLYAKTIAARIDPGDVRDFQIDIPDDIDPNAISGASLRLSVQRPHGADPRVHVRVNGIDIEVPLEDAASRYDDGSDDYAACKIVSLDPALLAATNTIEVRFDDDAIGSVGSVVLRVQTPADHSQDRTP